MSKLSRWIPLLALGMILAVALAPVAGACTTYRCALIQHPTNPFCFACVDTGAPTGTNCGSNGPCSCYFVQCAAFQQSTVESPLDGVLVAEPNACSAEGEASAPAAEPVPQPAEPTQAAA